jgi:hypothetical protein
MLTGMQPLRDMVIARETSASVVVGGSGLPFRQYSSLLDLSGAQMRSLGPPPPFTVLSAWDFVARRQTVVFGPGDLGSADGFLHLVVEKEETTPNGGALARASIWKRLGPWR